MSLNFTTTKNSRGFVKALAYGDSGVGKTRLCATAPNPLIISAESGLLSLAGCDLPVIEIATAADCFEALAFAQGSAEAHKFDTICLDSISDIAEVMLIEYKKEFKDPRQAYGKLADDIGTLIRSFRDLPKQHVYITAKQGVLVDEYTGLVKYSPSMPGKTLTTALPFFVDEVFSMQVKEGEDNASWRVLQTAVSTQFVAKDRSGALDFIERPDLDFIFNKIVNFHNIKTEVLNKSVTTLTVRPQT